MAVRGRRATWGGARPGPISWHSPTTTAVPRRAGCRGCSTHPGTTGRWCRGARSPTPTSATCSAAWRARRWWWRPPAGTRPATSPTRERCSNAWAASMRATPAPARTPTSPCEHSRRARAPSSLRRRWCGTPCTRGTCPRRCGRRCAGVPTLVCSGATPACADCCRWGCSGRPRTHACCCSWELSRRRGARPLAALLAVPYLELHLRTYDRTSRGLARAALDLPSRTAVDGLEVGVTAVAAARERVPVL